MNSPRLSFLILIFSLLSIEAFNINDTFQPFTKFIAFDLLGNSSSSFPGCSFLNYVLYGITEKRFYYKEFLLNYGFRVDNFWAGSLVIGNDGLIGGICYDNSIVIIPVTGATIQMIQISLLPKYFPNGYTILSNSNTFEYASYKGNIYSRCNSSSICMCNPCNMSLSSFPDSTLFSYGSQFYLSQEASPGAPPNFYIDFFGYFNKVDLEMQQGTMHIFFTRSNIYPNLNIFGPNTQHLIQFSIDPNNQFNFHGNVDIMFNGSMINYGFIGFLNKQAQGNFIA